MTMLFFRATCLPLAATALALVTACGGGSAPTVTPPVTVPSPSIFNITPQTAVVNVPVVLAVTGANLPSTVVLSMADATCTAPTGVTASSFSVSCTAQSAGSKTITVKTNTQANNGQVIDATRSVQVSAAPTATSKLPHSGITASQCYSAGSNALMACSGVATDLNGQQDGHRASINAMSYSAVGSYGKEECVKDNVTGLMWEGKTASGLRAGSNTYTNYHSSYYGTQTQMDAASNTYGYVKAVNDMALCGHKDWRLPTADELQTIVDYSRTSPSIHITWFPNTASNAYWSSSPYVGYSYGAWYVDFGNGNVSNGNRVSYDHVRLVRASQ